MQAGSLGEIIVSRSDEEERDGGGRAAAEDGVAFDTEEVYRDCSR